MPLSKFAIATCQIYKKLSNRKNLQVRGILLLHGSSFFRKFVAINNKILLMTTNSTSNLKQCTVVCPKCGRETSFNLMSDAIDEQGEVYRCQHCGWPFQYK